MVDLSALMFMGTGVPVAIGNLKQVKHGDNTIIAALNYHLTCSSDGADWY